MKLLKSLGFTFLLGAMVSALVLGTTILKNQIEQQQYGGQIESVPYDYVKQDKDSRAAESIENPIDKSKLKKSVKPSKISVLVLKKKNTLVFDSVVTSKSVADVQVKLLEMSNVLPKRATIYLVLNTPGGSVGAGSLLIDTMKAVPQKVKTLSLFSASMGFQFVQNMDERLVMPSSVLMSHRASVRGLSGEIYGELDSRLNAIKRRITQLDKIASKRMGMELKDYRELIADEYWAHGFESVEEQAADKMVLVRCDRSLTGTKKKEFRTLFGPVTVTLSKCPLITGPLDVDFSEVNEADLPAIKTFFSTLFEDKKKFVKDYVIENEYTKILQE